MQKKVGGGGGRENHLYQIKLTKIRVSVYKHRSVCSDTLKHTGAVAKNVSFFVKLVPTLLESNPKHPMKDYIRYIIRNLCLYTTTQACMK